MKIPSPALVVQAYLKSKVESPEIGVGTVLPELTVPGQNNLPKDNWSGRTSWVTARAIGTGVFFSAPVRQPFITVSVWTKPANRRRYWGDCESIAQEIRDLGTDWYSSVYLEMPYPGYRSVELTDFRPVTEVRRIEADPQGLGHCEVDFKISYSL